MRLNKFISETGACSRREADAWIAAGRVTVNGKPAVLGTQVATGDDVRLDGAALATKRRDVYIALNKPRGITCTTERHVEGNVVDFIAHPERIFPIGRLDKDSEGLILLTNNGDIVNEILRVEHGHEKEYLVTVERPVTATFLAMMAAGVKIGGEKTKPCVVTKTAPDTLPHRADAGPQPAGPPHVLRTRISRAAPGARAHHAHPRRDAGGRALARPERCRGPAPARGEERPRRRGLIGPPLYLAAICSTAIECRKHRKHRRRAIFRT